MCVSPIASAPSSSASASQSQSQQQSLSFASADSAAPGLAPRLSISSKRVSQPEAANQPTPTPMVLGLAATSRPSDGWPSSSTGTYYTTAPYYRGNGSAGAGAGASVAHYTASSTSGYSTNTSTEYGVSARVRQSSATPYDTEVVAGTVVGSGPTMTMLIPVADPSPVPEFGSVSSSSSSSELQRSQVSTSLLRGRPDRPETSAPGERPHAGAGAGPSLSAQTSISESPSAPLASSTLLAGPLPYPGVSSTRTTTTAELEDGWISTSMSPNANKRPMSRAFDSSTNASPLPLLATTNSNYLGGTPPIATIHSTGITRSPPSKPSGLPDPTNPAITLIRLARSELMSLLNLQHLHFITLVQILFILLSVRVSVSTFYLCKLFHAKYQIIC